MTSLRPAQLTDIPSLFEHGRRQAHESGRDGNLISSPNESPDERSLEKFEGEKRQKWSRSLTENNWERVWLLIDGTEIRGCLELVHSPPLATCLHRATLMMGLERSHCRLGWGSKLVSEAITWARAQPSLEWLQLNVFEHNEPAKRLYRKFGFQPVGTIPDMFRVFGQSVADTSMILKLK